MMIDRTDYLNGVRGVLDVFQEDAKTPDYWAGMLANSNRYVNHWSDKEPHLYSWYLGRSHALASILSLFVYEVS